MRLIQPNCRAQFAAEDIEFILSVLGKKIGTAECLTRLLADESSRDLILDDEALLKAVLERSGCLRVSTRLYFYLLVRNAFRRAGIEDRGVADYVAEVLSAFASSDRISSAGALRAEYLIDMLVALSQADNRTVYEIRVHIGNYALFFAGLFPERIRHRAELRGFPDLGYYENVGRSQYRAASDHPLAQRYAMDNVLATLAERFKATRLALNDIAGRQLSISESGSQFDLLLNKFLGQN
jgi:hypothetical protein